jgi:hypothetical protein
MHEAGRWIHIMVFLRCIKGILIRKDWEPWSKRHEKRRKQHINTMELLAIFASVWTFGPSHLSGRNALDLTLGRLKCLIKLGLNGFCHGYLPGRSTLWSSHAHIRFLPYLRHQYLQICKYWCSCKNNEEISFLMLSSFNILYISVIEFVYEDAETKRQEAGA